MRKIFLFAVILLILVISLISLSSIVFADYLYTKPNGQGFYTAWNNRSCLAAEEWKCVDDYPPVVNRSDYVFTGVNGNKETFLYNDTGLSNTAINYVTLYFYVARYSASKNTTQIMLRNNGVDYIDSFKYVLYSFWNWISRTYYTNPATNAPWTVADVDALEAGLMASNTSGGAYLATAYAFVNYVPPGTNCSETDGGYNIALQGTTSGFRNYQYYSYTDYCLDNVTLVEFYCSFNRAYNSTAGCIYYTNSTNSTGFCINGACV